MVNQSKKAGLGKTLHRAQKFANQRRNPRKSDRHTTELQPSKDYARLDLRSVTAQTNLDEFFEEAELAGKQFITERRNLKVIDENETAIDLYNHNERVELTSNIDIIDPSSCLCVPRRPKWDSSTTPEQLNELEKITFLTWRKKLAKLQEIENVTLTPFEKNLEVWRQLWRVVERSDIVVQILDCRNPILYICDDLIKYVNEEFGGKKKNLLLLNKADYLTYEQRKIWADYFKSRGSDIMFFSALLENENLKQRTSENENESPKVESDEVSSDDDDQDICGLVADKIEINLKLDKQEDDCRIYDKFELIDTWREILEKLNPSRDGVSSQIYSSHEDIDKHEETSEGSASSIRPLTVGLVGYPNVGKSSTINALLSAKRVAVSATPGKTKHFQTFLIDKDLMLCDCPGLVFPNFVSSKSEMVINGVLPIDQMKDYLGPVRIIVDRIPRSFLQEIYGLAFDQDAKQNLTAEDLLNAFGFMRGYMTARGLPDISRAARIVCKDYINGKLLYCEPPPNFDRKVYHSHSKLAAAMAKIEAQGNDPRQALRMTERQRRLMVQAKGTDVSSREFDAQYFRAQSSGAHIKGLPGIGNMTQPIGQHGEKKVLKREKKHKKKEKLRRVYRDLDI